MVDHAIPAITEKNEAVLHQPAEEVADFDEAARGRRLVANFERAPSHRIEVAGDLAHFVENLGELALQSGGGERAGSEIDLDVREGFGVLSRGGLLEGHDGAVGGARDLEQRMQCQAYVKSAFVQEL